MPQQRCDLEYVSGKAQANETNCRRREAGLQKGTMTPAVAAFIGSNSNHAVFTERLLSQLCISVSELASGQFARGTSTYTGHAAFL